MAQFQHTAARRRLLFVNGILELKIVSTHSRPKAAEGGKIKEIVVRRFNTQPPEGGCRIVKRFDRLVFVSTHSRPKAAGTSGIFGYIGQTFQHTAARRRLILLSPTKMAE